MTTDPFASASATATADPFGQKPSEVKTSSYPTMDELDHLLLVIQPTKLERVPDTFSNQAGAMRDRITADVTVINVEDPSASVTHSDMFISQNALVGQLKGFIETRGMLLGRLRKHVAKGTPDQSPYTGDTVKTPDDVDKLVQDWVSNGAKGNKPQFAWKLADFTATEKDVALAWYRSKQG